MKRTKAMDAMLCGCVVEAIEPLYMTLKKHGGWLRFRWNSKLHRLEYSTWLSPAEWRRAGNCFYLSDEFELVISEENESTQ